MADPPRLDRRPLLERPDLRPADRTRIGRAVASLLAWGLAATTLLATLALWHLIRRGRRLRANLANPRVVSLPEATEIPIERDPA
jgi:hypothetical protein